MAADLIQSQRVLYLAKRILDLSVRDAFQIFPVQEVRSERDRIQNKPELHAH